MGFPSLELTPLQPQRCNIDLCGLRLCCRRRTQTRGSLLLLVHIFQKHTVQFLEGWDTPWDSESSLYFFYFYFIFPLTISMPTVQYPLYFRHVLNSLYLFLVLCFCLKKKKKEREIQKVATSARPASYRQDAISPLVPLFRRFLFASTVWVQYEIEKGGGGDVFIASERL